MAGSCAAAPLLGKAPASCGVLTARYPYVFATDIDKILQWDRTEQMEQERRTWARCFNWDNIAKESIEIYRKVLR
jgi:glycosyltransferase involved in cell wall biosynthesis